MRGISDVKRQSDYFSTSGFHYPKRIPWNRSTAGTGRQPERERRVGVARLPAGRVTSSPSNEQTTTTTTTTPPTTMMMLCSSLLAADRRNQERDREKETARRRYQRPAGANLDAKRGASSSPSPPSPPTTTKTTTVMSTTATTTTNARILLLAPLRRTIGWDVLLVQRTPNQGKAGADVSPSISSLPPSFTMH